MKKIFSLDVPIDIASGKSVKHYQIGNAIVKLLPERPTWVVLSLEEEQIFDFFAANGFPRDAISKFGAPKVSLFLSKIEYAKFYKSDFSVERKLPLFLTLDLTHKCNLRCKHCYADAGKPLEKELTTSDWIKIIDEFSEQSKNAEITLTGGEPTIHPDFWEIVKHIKNNHHRLVVFTNGTTIESTDYAKRLSSLADVIQLSLDGLLPKTNDSLRGNNVWNRVNKLFQSIYNEQVQIRLSICVTPLNKSEISENIINFMCKIDPMKKIGVIFSPTLSSGRNSDGEYTLDYPEVQDMIGKQLLKLWKAGWRRPNTFQQNVRFQRCGIGGTIVVGPNGDLHACTFAPPTGNILESELFQWHNNELEELKRFSVDTHPICSSCDLRYICRGGCWISNTTHPCGISADLCDQRNKMFFFNKIIDESVAVFPDTSLSISN